MMWIEYEELVYRIAIRFIDFSERNISGKIQ